MELKEIFQPISGELSQVERELKGQVNLLGKNQEFVGEIINRFFNAPGKRLRPALVLLSAKASGGRPVSDRPAGIRSLGESGAPAPTPRMVCGGIKTPTGMAVEGGATKGASSPDCVPPVQRRQSPDRLIILATAIELIHSASLIHDDIVDIAFSRRGQPSLNEQFGNKIAVLAGDMLYARTFSLLTDNFDKKILSILSKCVEKMCRGEINEFKKSPPSFEEYLQINEDKTASFMSVCCECGTILNGADEKLSQTLADYGFNFGMAYQIIDDYIDKDSVNVKDFTLEKAEEFASGAKRSIKDLKSSIYKEKLLGLIDHILSRSHMKEVTECL